MFSAYESSVQEPLVAGKKFLNRTVLGQVLPLAKIPAALPHMSRPLRIEFPGAGYHVTARGDRREPIYRDDADRTAQLHVIAQAMERKARGRSALTGFLGDEDFVARMQALASTEQRSAGYVPKAQRKSPSTLQDCLRRTADRPEALRIAYRECGITMTAMAKELQLYVSRISRPIAAANAVEGGLKASGKN